MRLRPLVSLILSAGCLVSVPVFGFDGNHPGNGKDATTEAPQMNALSAKTAKPGDTLVISGVGLSENRIDEVYLTDHKFDMKMKVLEQQDSYIKVRVPPFAKPGRMQILCLTKGADPTLLEQPLYVLIRDPSDPAADESEPTKVEVIEMKPEDLPKPGAPITIPILAQAPPVQAEAKPDAAVAKKVEATPQVTQAKKAETAKLTDPPHDKQ